MFGQQSSSTSRLWNFKSGDLGKHLRSYPTESQEFIDCKADNRYHSKVLTTSKEQHNPALSSMNKLFTLREQISTIGSQKATVKSPRVLSEHVSSGFVSPKSFGRKLDAKLPQKELSDLANFFERQTSDQVKLLSKSYVSEMVNLSQCIEKKLRLAGR